MTEDNKMGFFTNPTKPKDLTTIPGNKELLKPKTPKKTYTCNDCGRCAHALVKVRDYENDTPAEYNEKGKIKTKEKLAYKMIPKGGNEMVGVHGAGKKKILIVADEVSEGGVASGKPMVGQEAKLMKKSLKEAGIDMDEDCWVVNAIRGTGDPKQIGIANKACREVLHEDIKKLKPKAVITLGFRPLSTLIGGKTSITDQWSKFEGEEIPDQDLETVIYPTWSARDFLYLLSQRRKKFDTWKREKEKKEERVSRFYKQATDRNIPLVDNEVLRSDEYKIKYRRFHNTLQKVVDHLDRPFIVDDTADKLELLYEQKDILEAIYYFHSQKTIAVDIEANSLKGYRKEANIICIGISNLKRSVGFMTNDPVVIEETKKLIASDTVKKICHNNPYEWAMFKNVWDVEMENVLYDSMLLAHTADHRTGVCGLKHQVYVKFGQKGFDAKCKPFFNQLSPVDKGTRYHDKKNNQRINGLEEALKRGKLYKEGLLFPIEGKGKEITAENRRRNKLYNSGWLFEEEILFYVASDAHYTAKLVNHLIPTLTPREIEAAQFFTQGALALSHMTQHGLYVNRDVLHTKMTEIDKKIAELSVTIMETDEVKQWDGDTPFSPSSNKQLTHLLFDIMKNPVISRTATGAPQANKTVLEKLGTPLCKALLEQKKLAKIKSTYMEGWDRATDENSICHPEFLLFSTSSFRSSSSDPNAQNSPKRDPLAKELSRVFLEPHPGQILLEYDYSGK